MKRLFPLLTAAVAALFMAGCARINSQVVEKPRVDQDLQGNRGYLVGEAPPAGERKMTRQVLETNVEMPTARELNPWKVKRGSAAAPQPETSMPAPTPSMPMESTQQEEMNVAPIEQAQPAEEAAPAATTYTVKRGDTLEKIAVKVYGDSNQWRRIYKANQTKLKSPSKIYPGQKLVIPPYQKKHKENFSSDIK